MLNTYYAMEAAGISAMLVYLLVTAIRFRQLSEKIETMRVEQEKINFRLFVYEKTQKLSNEKKIS